MSIFVLEDTVNASNSIVLDDNVINIEISGIKRKIDLIDFIGDGSYYRNSNYLGSREITFSRKDKASPSENIAWNSTRYAFYRIISSKNLMKLTLTSPSLGSESSNTEWNIYGYISDIGGDKFNNYKTIQERSFTMICPNGYFIGATEQQYLLQTVGTTIELYPENKGTIETPFKFIFRVYSPGTYTCILWKDANEGFSFTVESLGNQVEVDISNNTINTNVNLLITVPPVLYDLSSSIISGKPFNLSQGQNTIYFKVIGQEYTSIEDFYFKWYERAL